MITPSAAVISTMSNGSMVLKLHVR